MNYIDEILTKQSNNNLEKFDFDGGGMEQLKVANFIH